MLLFVTFMCVLVLLLPVVNLNCVKARLCNKKKQQVLKGEMKDFAPPAVFLKLLLPDVDVFNPFLLLQISQRSSRTVPTLHRMTRGPTTQTSHPTPQMRG